MTPSTAPPSVPVAPSVEVVTKGLESVTESVVALARSMQQSMEIHDLNARRLILRMTLALWAMSGIALCMIVLVVGAAVLLSRQQDQQLQLQALAAKLDTIDKTTNAVAEDLEGAPRLELRAETSSSAGSVVIRPRASATPSVVIPLQSAGPP